MFKFLSCKFLSIFTAAAALSSVLTPAAFAAIVYSGPTDTTHAIDPAIPTSDSRFVQWADYIDPTRTAFAARGSTSINQSGGFNNLGDLTAEEISNSAMPGYLTVSFPTAIGNGSGADFAVFENGFLFGPAGRGLFAEYAYVDVSSNGSDFARFPSISLNTGPLSGNSPFASFDSTGIYNLAGKHAAGYGTPFDLQELSSDPLVTGGLLDLNNIQYVRLFDIPGNGAFKDSLGNPIYDNWLTTGSGGFDFRLGVGLGVGVINVASVPEPSGFALLSLWIASLATFHRRRRLERLCLERGA